MFEFIKKLFSRTSDVQLKQLIDQGAYLVDVRTPSEFDAGHVRGSVNIPLDRIPTMIDSLKNKSNIIIYCQNGMRSNQAQMILKQNGVENVYNGGTWLHVNQIKNS